MSEEIVRKLLENDAIDPKAYAMALKVDLSGATPQQLDTFKRQAIGYIKWINRGDESVSQDWKQDIKAIRKAYDFDQVAPILARYDSPGCEFLSMIAQGYF
jgi:hypothetical protein